MRILVSGATGMLGTDVLDALADHATTGVGSADLDVRDLDACIAAARGVDAIVHCAGHTRVDDAESESELAHAVNATGAEHVALAAREAGAVLVHVSTDYVFDGTARTPYPESAPVHPISAYGRSKAEGERLAVAANPDTIVLRTAWLYGRAGGSFPRTVLRLADQHEILRVVDDQWGQPTWTRDLAAQIRALLERGVRSGILHGTNAGVASRFEFARAVFERAGLDPERVQPAATSDFPMPAARPAWSVLGHEGWASVGIPPMRDWKSALDEAFARGEVTRA